MQVVIATECRFIQDEQGLVCSDNGTRAYSFWSRYLSVFDSVKVVGRLCSGKSPAMQPVEGPGVIFCPLPGYVGPIEYWRNQRQVKDTIRQVCSEDSAFIGRCPGMVSNIMIRELEKTGSPYAIEIVGDPYDIFAPGAVRHPLRPYFRWSFSRQLRKQAENACAAIYVTENALQRRYPCPGFTTYASNVEIGDSAYVSEPRVYNNGQSNFQIVTVGSMAQMYKGFDVLIDAVADCSNSGLDLRLNIIGDGKHRAELEKQVRSLGLNDKIHFLGQLSAGEVVRQELDKADVFVLPSKTEGLPRAMIEAMSRAVPCIGSKVGGIPELLPEEDLVSPGSVKGLACKIREVISDPARMARMSARNLKKAKHYHIDTLCERRNSFFQNLEKKTSDWQSKL